MRRDCETCGTNYDDERFLTLCPHPELGERALSPGERAANAIAEYLEARAKEPTARNGVAVYSLERVTRLKFREMMDALRAME